MEGATTDTYKGVKSFWNRRGYTRLNDGSRWSRRRSSGVELPADGSTSTSSSRKRFWRIKLTPRLKLKHRRFSLKKLCIKLRDGYVNMMMKLASSPFINGGASGYVGDGAAGFGVRPLKEYDEKMIIEIYKSLVLKQGNVLPDASKLSTLPPTSSAVITTLSK